MPVPVVGIGASAGGLDAYQRLLQRLPARTGLAYVLVQHLDPEHESLLPALLARTASIPVVHAEDGAVIKADRAYVIPPNTTMTVTEGHLRLVARPKGRGPHLPINAFLSSLAVMHGSSAIGVILSGAGSDGTRGIESIKEAGGITLAQDSASAHYASMPESAIDTGAVDFILAPEEIADQLARLGAYLARHPEDATPPSEAPTGGEEEALQKILALLHKRSGVDFRLYRRGTLHRRILRRMLGHRQDTRSEYLAHLRLNPAELDLLYEDLLIGVTRFFRDPNVFAELQATVFPAMLQRHARDAAIRMWVAGCATGEEAYSLGIALLEFLGDAATDVPIQIFGTDLSDASIGAARTGFYPDSIAEHVSPERLRRFFSREPGGYRINKAVRDLCVFSRQDVVGDPPFSHLDLVACRNVLIYMEPVLQRRVIPIFHYALEPNGLLLLGRAESVGSSSEYFEPVVKRNRIYRRRAVATRSLEVDLSTPTAVPAIGATRRRGTVRVFSTQPPAADIGGEADRLILAQLVPPSVVINENMEILQFRGDTRGILAHASGTASLELLKLARPDLVLPLHAAIRRARADNQPVRESGIALVDGDAIRQVTINVLPFRPASTSGLCFVVSFTIGHVAVDDPAATAAESGGESGSKPEQRRRARVNMKEHYALRDKLAATKRYLQDIVDQQEATLGELRAANEEIQSSNEELQSTNEELETTKEEVQSTNEELTTLNEELRHRNRELLALSGDLSNILANTTIPIVIVGADLRLRRFTPATERVMHVIASDVGRPLGNVKLRVAVPELELQIVNAIETLAVIEHEVRDAEGRWWALTIRPYQTIDRRVDGAVLVFADIDASKRYGERADEVSEVRRHLLDVAEAGRTMAEEARKVAEIANRTKSTFLASMSHDLRTPLNAISGYTDLLEFGVHGPVTPAQLEDLARIKSSARYLLALINDILNFAKVEAGQLDFHMVDVRVADIGKEMHELVAPQLAAQRLHFERADSDAVVRADPEKMRQILLNLLSNALKFTAPGGTIGIDYVTMNNVVRIEVWDTGCGIPQGQLDHIFEPFVQVDRGLTSPAPGGVGLGLAISRDLARAMKGGLTVESVLGHGSRFALTLPRVS